jgi:hypothetical protein
MGKKQSKEDRHLELSSKFLEMGKALMTEGMERNDYTISQTGTFMILIGGLLFNEEDVQQFGQLCSMFSAKKILDNMEATKNDMSQFLKNKADGESYEDFIKRINDLRNRKGLPPDA